MAEALGLSLPQNAAIPALDSRRLIMAQLTGRRIVEMVHQDLKLSRHSHARGVRERDPGQRRGRRLDQRGHPPAGDRRPRRRQGHARRLGQARARRADAGRPDAVGQVPDGGLLLRRRPADVVRALGEKGLLNKDALTVNGKSIWDELPGRAELQRRRDPAVRQAARRERRHRGAARQSGAGRRACSSRRRPRRTC